MSSETKSVKFRQKAMRSSWKLISPENSNLDIMDLPPFSNKIIWVSFVYFLLFWLASKPMGNHGAIATHWHVRSVQRGCNSSKTILEGVMFATMVDKSKEAPRAPDLMEYLLHFSICSKVFFHTNFHLPFWILFGNHNETTKLPVSVETYVN